MVQLALTSVLLASATISLALVAGGQARTAFYNPLARFWELGLGVALAVFADRVLVRAVFGWVALVVLGVVVAIYGAATSFPGLAATAPVLAAAILIAAAPGSDGLTAWLSARPATWVGDRSYGWYLWHWPLIVFAGQLWGYDPLVLVVAGAAALIPTALSYRWVELPVHDRRRAPGSRRLAVGLLATLALVVGTGVATHAGAQRRWGLSVGVVIDRGGIAYTNYCYGDPGSLDGCTYAPVHRPVGAMLLIGDSHALSIADGFTAAANELGYTAIIAALCPVSVTATYHFECSGYHRNIERIIAEQHPDVVVVAQRSTKYIPNDVAAPNDEDSPLRTLDGEVVEDQAEALELWIAGLAKLRQRLDQDGIPLISIDVVPEFRRPFQKSIRLISPEPTIETISRAELDERRAEVIAAEHSALEADHWIDPADVLCDESTCSSVSTDGEWLYFDDSHLNPAGAMMLTGHLASELKRLLG